MFNDISANWYRRELPLAFDLAVRTGFITKACLQYITGENGDAGNYRFINAMNKSGMFSLSSYGHHFPTWTLSELGLQKAKAAGLNPAQPADKDSFFHDATALNLALEFQRRGLAGVWANQVQLKKEEGDRNLDTGTTKARRVPDVLLRRRNLESSEIAIELELPRKRCRRYGRLLRGYMGSTGIELLLIVHMNDRLPSWISAHASRLKFPSHRIPIVLVDLRDLFHDYECGPARSKPDHEGFARIISQIHHALVSQIPVSSPKITTEKAAG